MSMHSYHNYVSFVTLTFDLEFKVTHIIIHSMLYTLS